MADGRGTLGPVPLCSGEFQQIALGQWYLQISSVWQINIVTLNQHLKKRPTKLILAVLLRIAFYALIVKES